ncbi:membrane protein of ER body-like protein isoform X3 [Corylus avellana]|uniref:membrane protein of ER body-like protein isoform X3 n=1 Tax=Corylus avellana TaxID=13451 RepID=UPI00286B20EA|nr:membrane protein of ER body-like protein isoform X3 [Corylus avellana]
MEPPQQQHKEYQWEEADDANLQPRQSRRHRLNNHAATTDIISPSTGSGGSCNSSITDDAGSSIQSMTASRAGSATPSFKEEEEIADNNSISEEVDNEYDHTACTEFHGARENGKSTKLDNSVYFDNGQGTDPTHEVSGIRNTGHECSIFWTKLGDEELYSTVENSNIPKGTGTEVNSHYGENFDDRTFSGSRLLPVEKSSEVQSTSVKLINNEARVEVGVDLAGKIEGQVIDLDVEAVLERQETHDLYCPNCNSCITRRIILRKRKRKVRNLHLKAKRDKYEMVLGSESVTNPINAANQGDDTGNTFSSGSPTNADEGYTADREVDIFRCLSCFTIFIPSGDGFNLFQNFRDSRGKENVQNPRKITASSTNWFFSLFASNKGKMATEEGNNIKSQHGGLKSLVPSAGESLMLEKSQIKIEHRSNVALGNEPLGDQKCLASSFDGASCVQSSCSIGLADDVATELWEVRKDVVDSSTPEDIPLGNLSTTVEEKLDDSIEKRKADNMPPQLRRDHPTILVARRKLVYSGKHAEDASLNPQKDGDEFLVHSIPWSLTPEQSHKEIDHKSNIAQNCHASLVQGALSPCQSLRNEVHKNDATTELHETGIDTVVSSTKGGTLLQKEESNVIEKLDYADRKNESGENVIVIVEAEPVEPAASQRAQNTAAPVGAEMLHQSGEDHEWDILKSIVYGGLIESITSLGVVSSAAGAGAAPTFRAEK